MFKFNPLTGELDIAGTGGGGGPVDPADVFFYANITTVEDGSYSLMEANKDVVLAISGDSIAAFTIDLSVVVSRSGQRITITSTTDVSALNVIGPTFNPISTIGSGQCFQFVRTDTGMFGLTT